MKKEIFSPPDQFSLSPLLSILPKGGKLSALQGLTESLYARYEKIRLMKGEGDGALDPTLLRRLSAEESLVQAILDYLSDITGTPGVAVEATLSSKDES